MSKRQKLAIFDFDRTIVSKDTGHEFLKYMCRKRLSSFLFASILAPIGVIVFFTKSQPKIGYSILLWAVTFGLDYDSLERIKNQFIIYCRTHNYISIRKDAIFTINNHVKMGHKIIIVTGAFEWMVAGILKDIIKEYIIISSTEKKVFMGTICGKHCHGYSKITMIRRKIDYDSVLLYCYTDCVTDIPLLNISLNRVVVNPKKSYMKRFKIEVKCPFKVVSWA